MTNKRPFRPGLAWLIKWAGLGLTFTAHVRLRAWAWHLRLVSGLGLGQIQASVCKVRSGLNVLALPDRENRRAWAWHFWLVLGLGWIRACVYKVKPGLNVLPWPMNTPKFTSNDPVGIQFQNTHQAQGWWTNVQWPCIFQMWRKS